MVLVLGGGLYVGVSGDKREGIRIDIYVHVFDIRGYTSDSYLLGG